MCDKNLKPGKMRQIVLYTWGVVFIILPLVFLFTPMDEKKDQQEHQSEYLVTRGGSVIKISLEDQDASIDSIKRKMEELRFLTNCLKNKVEQLDKENKL